MTLCYSLIRMSSTRESLYGLREENSLFSSYKHQLKESQDMVQDLQKLTSINREAISLFDETSVNAKDKIVSNLRAENAILFQALSRSVGCQRKLEHMVDRRAYAGRAAEKQIRWS